MQAWSSFFQVQAGASATLLGLVFVSLTINSTRIIASKHLPNRALEALVILFLNLAFASICLVPGQAARMPAIETLALVGLVWVILSLLHHHTLRHIHHDFRHRAWFNLAVGQIVAVSWFLGGLALWFQGEAGVGWLVPSILLSYALALLNAWVLLVEINR
jgi:hypothetical protein